MNFSPKLINAFGIAIFLFELDFFYEALTHVCVLKAYWLGK